MQLLDRVMFARHASNPTGSFAARRWGRHRTAGVATIPRQCVGTLVHKVNLYFWVVKFEDELVTMDEDELTQAPALTVSSPTISVVNAHNIQNVEARIRLARSGMRLARLAESYVYRDGEHEATEGTAIPTVVPDSGQELPPDPVWEEFVSST